MKDRTTQRQGGWKLIPVLAFVAGTTATLAASGAQPTTVTRPPGTTVPGRTTSVQPTNQPTNPPAGQRGGRVITRPPTPAGEQPPAEQGGEEPRTEPMDQIPVAEGDEVELSAFTEPVELSTLIDYVVRSLGINVTVKSGLTGSVVFNAPVKIPKSRLLALLDALLEQQGYTITYDELSQFYSVHPSGDVPINLAHGESATTRVFSTPNVRPSALKSAIDAQTGGGGFPGQPQGQPGQPGQRQYAYIDELGVIVATDSVRKLAQVESLIQRLLEERSKSRFIRIELAHIAAPVARERALQLVGQGSSHSGGLQDINLAIQQQQQQQGIGGGAGGRGSFDNLADRLTIDPQGNALIFRGIPEEIDQVKLVLEIIDVPSKLIPRKHEVGKAARPIAEIARQRGLGDVTQIADTKNSDPNNPLGIAGGGLTFADPSQQNQKQTSLGGPVMVVDETRGVIIYYGTEDQQVALKALVDELRTDDDRIVFRDYKLKNAKAEDVAQLILGVINNQTPTLSEVASDSGDSSTGSSGSSFGSGNRSNSFFDSSNSGGRRSRNSTRNPTGSLGSSAEDGLSIENAEDIFIVADRDHNQLIVKAPIRDQENLSKLINKLDLRRPQVYIEAKIVVVNWSDELRLAFETQLINAGGTGGVFNTNFGLTTAGSNVLTPKTVSALTGLTAAVIKSDQVPIVMNALQTEVDGKLLSTPQVLVDDNTKATIKSKDKQPTTTTTIGSGGNPNTTTFNDYVEAGTELNVTPTISEGGYIRLDYEINLSSFTGTGSNGVPPPILDNTLTAKSVTVPSDATVVLGGLTFDSEATTSKGIPILKDIPLIGLLFQDLNKLKRKTTLYVFLTPRIMRDPNFEDLRLMQEGPQSAVGITDFLPKLKPTFIDVIDAAAPAGAPGQVPSSSSPSTAEAKSDPLGKEQGQR